MKCDRIDHVGIAVRSIADQRGLWTGPLALGDGGIEEVPEQKVRVAFFPVGESRIELLEPTCEDSPVAKFIEAWGEGIHHLALRVDDIRSALDTMHEAGYRLIDREPRRGAGGALIAFVHPRATGGVLLELCQHE